MIFDDHPTPYTASRPLGLEQRSAMKILTFRTTKDGKIPLGRDWPKLLDGLGRFPRLIIQSRHQYARLVSLTPPPAFHLANGIATSFDSHGALCLAPGDHWTACATLAKCRCCGSPGKIELHNEHGMEFFNFAAPEDCNATDWADFLSGLVSGDAVMPAPGAKPVAARTFPRLKNTDVRLANDTARLVDLLTHASHAGIALAFTLETPDVRHTRIFELESLGMHKGLLSAGGDGCVCQLALPFVRGLAIDPADFELGLKVHGSDGSVLLRIAAAPGDADHAVWQDLLLSAFPNLG